VVTGAGGRGELAWAAVMKRGNAPGLVYLLHFDATYVPYPGAPRRDCAEHYTGRVRGGPRALGRRLKQHGTVSGARLMLAVRAAGITWQLARTWPGGSDREKQLKRQGGASRRCPLCGVKPRSGELPRNASGSVSRSLVTDEQLARAGLMTAAAKAEHTELRRGAAAGRVQGLVRLAGIPADDCWYAAPVALAGQS
jgi:hypothetical protein